MSSSDSRVTPLGVAVAMLSLCILTAMSAVLLQAYADSLDRPGFEEKVADQAYSSDTFVE